MEDLNTSSRGLAFKLTATEKVLEDRSNSEQDILTKENIESRETLHFCIQL